MLGLDFLHLTLPLGNLGDCGQKRLLRSSLGSSRRYRRDDVADAGGLVPILVIGSDLRNYRLNQREGERRDEMMVSRC
jgi:hypothetical protein